jgi:hypothetical protein
LRRPVNTFGVRATMIDLPVAVKGDLPALTGEA